MASEGDEYHYSGVSYQTLSKKKKMYKATIATIGLDVNM